MSWRGSPSPSPAVARMRTPSNRRAEGPVAYTHLATAEDCFYGHTVAGN